METNFTRFLRAGGNGEFVLSRAANGLSARQPLLSIKADIPGFAQLREQFSRNLERADLLNRDLILKFLRDGYELPLEADDLADVSGDMADALEAWEDRITALWQDWSERPSRFAALRRACPSSGILGQMAA